VTCALHGTNALRLVLDILALDRESYRTEVMLHGQRIESDVRAVDAVVLPRELGTGGGTIAAEGFQADISELNVWD
jgi:hypothetical protein